MATSMMLILDWVTGATTGHDVVRFGVGVGRGTADVRRWGGRQDYRSGLGRRKRGYQGDHAKPLPFVRRVLGHIQLYG